MGEQNSSILLIDDDETILRTATMMLTSLGYSVETASSGREGIEILSDRADSFGLVLTDFSMPDMDGREMVRLARQQGPMPPFVVVSGYVLEEEDLKNDFVAMLLKPFRMRDLVATLEQLIGSPS